MLTISLFLRNNINYLILLIEFRLNTFNSTGAFYTFDNFIPDSKRSTVIQCPFYPQHDIMRIMYS